MEKKIDHLKSKKNPKDQIKDSDEVSRLKKENEILKHELKIIDLNLSLKDDTNKVELYLKSENAYLRSNLTKVTHKLESTKL